MHQATEQYQNDYWVKLHTYISDPLPPEEYLPSVDIRSLENYARYGWTYLHGSGGIYVDTRTQVIDDNKVNVFINIDWASVDIEERIKSRTVNIYWGNRPGRPKIGYENYDSGDI